MYKEEIQRQNFDNLDFKVVNAILSFYSKIRTRIQKNNIEFSFESLLLGTSFEVSYRHGTLTDVNFVCIQGSPLYKQFESLYKEEFIDAIKNSYLGGIPYEIKDHGDIKVRGIITLNKEELKKYFEKNLSKLIKTDIIDIHNHICQAVFQPSEIVFLRNWYFLLSKQYYTSSLSSSDNLHDWIFLCLMLNYPYESIDKNGIKFLTGRPAKINKNL